MSNINVEYKNVFVHVPKTAGTAMEQKPFVGGSGHDNLYKLSKHNNFRNKYFKWAFVRNPYTRLASAYFYGINNLQRGIKFKDPDKDFHSFVRHLEENLGEDPYNAASNITRNFIHIMPQTYFLASDGINLDFVGKYENLQAGWEHVIVKIIENSGRKDLLKRHRYHILKMANRTKWRPSNYMDIYDKEIKNIVYKVYEKDFDTFKYKR